MFVKRLFRQINYKNIPVGVPVLYALCFTTLKTFFGWERLLFRGAYFSGRAYFSGGAYFRYSLASVEKGESERVFYNLAKRYLHKANNILSTFKKDKRRHRIYFLNLYLVVEFIF